MVPPDLSTFLHCCLLHMYFVAYVLCSMLEDLLVCSYYVMVVAWKYVHKLLYEVEVWYFAKEFIHKFMNLCDQSVKINRLFIDIVTYV